MKIIPTVSKIGQITQYKELQHTVRLPYHKVTILIRSLIIYAFVKFQKSFEMFTIDFIHFGNIACKFYQKLNILFLP